MRHLLNRTSPKGQQFIGTCALCGRAGLSFDSMNEECENVRGLSQDDAIIEAVTSNNWPNPTPEMLNDPDFNKIWNAIKSWDINVPHAYSGYCGATGNHVRAILDALRGGK